MSLPDRLSRIKKDSYGLARLLSCYYITYMQKFEGISFLWAMAGLMLIGLIYGIRAFIGYRNVARDAESDYDYKYPKGMIDKRLSREGYIQAYKRSHNPRSAAYIAGTVAAILILTWPAMAVIGFALEQLYQATGRSRVFEPGFLVWQFLIFFAMIAIWVTIASMGARRYHRGAPISFRDEMIREMDREAA